MGPIEISFVKVTIVLDAFNFLLSHNHFVRFSSVFVEQNTLTVGPYGPLSFFNLERKEKDTVCPYNGKKDLQVCEARCQLHIFTKFTQSPPNPPKYALVACVVLL